MPRQKFCSVPGCLSTTELIKREQETFLGDFCKRCQISRPCRCPAPDIYTTRKETRTKFTSWCNAIGLKDPGYYINVCYKHFSTGCPSRTCPNPDVVVPVWEKHVRDKMSIKASSESNQKLVAKQQLSHPLIIDRSSSTGSSTSSSSDGSNDDEVELSQNLPPDLYRFLSSILQQQRNNPNCLLTFSAPSNLPKTPLTQSALKRASSTSLQKQAPPLKVASVVSSVKQNIASLAPVKTEPNVIEISTATGVTLDLSTLNDYNALLESVNPPLAVELDEPDFSLPSVLMDPSEDPCLNEGNAQGSCRLPASATSAFVTDDLDTIHKWLEVCESTSNV